MNLLECVCRGGGGAGGASNGGRLNICAKRPLTKIKTAQTKKKRPRMDDRQKCAGLQKPTLKQNKINNDNIDKCNVPLTVSLHAWEIPAVKSRTSDLINVL